MSALLSVGLMAAAAAHHERHLPPTGRNGKKVTAYGSMPWPKGPGRDSIRGGLTGKQYRKMVKKSRRAQRGQA